MTIMRVVNFMVNICEFILLEYYLKSYLHTEKMSFLKIMSIVVCSGILLWVNGYQHPSWNVFIMYILVMTYAIIFGQGTLTKKFAFSIVFVAMSSMSELICTICLAIIRVSSIRETTSNICFYILSGIAGKLMLFFIIYFIKKKFTPLSITNNGSDIILLSFFPASVVILMIIIVNENLKNQLLILFLMFIFLFQTIMGFFIYNNALQKKELERRVQMDDEMRSMNERLFNQQQREIDSLQRIKHEFKRHLLCIYDYSQDGKLAEVYSYCKKLMDEVQKEEHIQLLDFKNFTISNIYARFISNCDINSIKYNVDITFGDFSFIRDIDAAVLFSNLFDNALEACKQMTENQWIVLKIYPEQGNVIIKLTNSTCTPIKKVGKYFLSTKRNYSSPGVGVKQIVSIAEMYGGYATNIFREGVFEATIRLPFPPSAV